MTSDLLGLIDDDEDDSYTLGDHLSDTIGSIGSSDEDLDQDVEIPDSI